jgi:hypothetical protein
MELDSPEKKAQLHLDEITSLSEAQQKPTKLVPDHARKSESFFG